MVVSETAPIPDDLLNISLEEVVFDVQWEPTVKEILPDKTPLVVEETVEDLVKPVLDVEPEKEKPPAASRSRCLRSSAPERVNERGSRPRSVGSALRT